MTISAFGPFPAQLDPRWLDRGHPLVNGLRFLSFPGLDAVDLVRGLRPRSRPGVYGTSDVYGPNMLVKTGSGNCLVYPTWPLLPANCSTHSMAILAKPASASRSTQPLRISNAAATVLIAFLFNSDKAGSAQAGTVCYLSYSSSEELTAAKLSIIDGNWHLFSASRASASTGDIYLDGVAQAAGTSGSTSTNNVSPQDIYVGGVTGADVAANYPIAMVAIWNRALSAVEHLEFALNPWVILRAPARTILRRVNSTAAAAFNAAWNVGANTVVQPGALQA